MSAWTSSNGLSSAGLISVTLGRKLTWEAGKEKFVNDNAANAMMNRPFREKWLDKEVVDWINQFQQWDLS